MKTGQWKKHLCVGRVKAPEYLLQMDVQETPLRRQRKGMRSGDKIGIFRNTSA